MAIINKKTIKLELKKEKSKISSEALNIFINNQEIEIKKQLKILTRNAKLSGRKTIHPEDIDDMQ
ncbi:MAG: hypothetical protein WC533_04385 [Candidatus Pacearchaeota archaeon]